MSEIANDMPLMCCSNCGSSEFSGLQIGIFYFPNNLFDFDVMLEEGNLVRYFNDLCCSSCGELIYDPKKSFFFPSFEICDQDEADFQLQCLIRALDAKRWKNENLFVTVSPGYIAFDKDSEEISDISPLSENVISAEDIEFSEEFDAFTYDLNVVYKISELSEDTIVQ
jgi:hypothetical protein